MYILSNGDDIVLESLKSREGQREVAYKEAEDGFPGDSVLSNYKGKKSLREKLTMSLKKCREIRGTSGESEQATGSRS